MIWYFIAGFISGAVGVVMYAHWWIHKHTKVITTDELVREMNKEEETHD